MRKLILICFLTPIGATAFASEKPASGLQYGSSKPSSSSSSGSGTRRFAFEGPNGQSVVVGGTGVQVVTPVAEEPAVEVKKVKKTAVAKKLGPDKKASTKAAPKLILTAGPDRDPDKEAEAASTATGAKTRKAAAVVVQQTTPLASAERVERGMNAVRLMAMRKAQVQGVQQPVVVMQDNVALQVLRTLPTEDLRSFLAIPQASIVACGGTVPPSHLISGKIPDSNQREALRGWVKSGGDWRNAVQTVLNERGG